MQRHLVPVTMIIAMVALAVAALTVGATPYHPAWWRAAITLALLGGITPMIYAVNIRIIPVFARRSWPALTWLVVQVSLAIAGSWVAYGGIMAEQPAMTTLGSILALLGGLVFFGNIVSLWRQAPTGVAPPTPVPDQASVDRIATRFTRLAGIYLVIGLSVGALISSWTPPFGRWDLVWAHTMLVGFFLSMAVGVCYHVLSRWSGRPWRAVALIRIHWWVVVIGLPVMLLALATEQRELFAIAGTLQAAAVLLFVVTVGRQVLALPGLTRWSIASAAMLLLLGVGLGAWFALDPAAGARYRAVHAGLNLFGGAGLLISGAGYYLVPLFAGRPQRWPRLAMIQVSLLAAGVLLGAVSRVWWVAEGGPVWPIVVAQIMITGGFGLFGLLIAGTVYQPGRGNAASLTMARRPTLGVQPRGQLSCRSAMPSPATPLLTCFPGGEGRIVSCHSRDRTFWASSRWPPRLSGSCQRLIPPGGEQRR